MKYNDLKEIISGIYKINFPNNKIYIGRAINIKKRIYEHYQKDDNTVCQQALYKYYSSYQDIDFDILEVVEEYNLQNVCELEKNWIKTYSSYNKDIGYNLTDGGDGGGNGVYNTASKFSQEDLNHIIDLLQQGKTNVQIAFLYNVNQETIGRINRGKTYFNPNLNYPIKKEHYKKNYLDTYNGFTIEQLELAILLLKETDQNYSNISIKTKISKSSLVNINTGKHPYCQNININFPIRQTRKGILFSDEEIQRIKKDLLNENLSIQNIADNFKCSRDTISNINQGKSYYKDNENYPIRNFYPNRTIKKPVSTILGTEE